MIAFFFVNTEVKLLVVCEFLCNGINAICLNMVLWIIKGISKDHQRTIQWELFHSSASTFSDR